MPHHRPEVQGLRGLAVMGAIKRTPADKVKAYLESRRTGATCSEISRAVKLPTTTVARALHTNPCNFAGHDYSNDIPAYAIGKRRCRVTKRTATVWALPYAVKEFTRTERQCAVCKRLFMAPAHTLVNACAKCTKEAPNNGRD